MKQKYKDILIYLVPSIFVVIIFSLIYYFKGFFPFGNNSIAWGDMYQQQIPFHYKLFDILRGTDSIFYDFSSSMGISFLGIITYYLISPFSLLVALFPREFIPYFMNILLILKVCSITISSMYFFKKIFKNLSLSWMVFFSLCYGFCSYTFIMYQIIEWLDFLIIFPLLILSLKKLFDNGNPLYYIAIITISITFNFYIAFMMLLFTLFSSYIYLKLYSYNYDTRDRTFKLGVSTLLSVLVTLPVTLPTILQIFKSNRVPSSIGDIIFSSSFAYLLDKISFFFLCGAIVPFVLMLILKYKENRKIIILCISTLILTTVQIFIDQSNKLWHMGSYSGFPLRFGFIPIFILIFMAAFYINKYGVSGPTNKKLLLVIPVCLIFPLVHYYLYKNYYGEIQNTLSSLTLHSDKKIFLILFSLFILCTICYLIIFKLLKGKLLFAVFSLFLFIQILFNGFIYIGIDKFTPIVTEEYNKLNTLAKYNFNDNSFFRVKDINGSFNSNMSWISNLNSLSHFTSLTGKNHMDFMKSIGYSSVWMRTSDMGGTIFSDSLFNIKYTLSTEDINSDFYSYYDSIDGINIFINDYFIPNGLVLPKYTKTNNILNASSVFEAQNNLYKSLSNDEENLFTEYTDFTSFNLDILSDGNSSTYSIIDKNQPAYLEFSINCYNNELYFNLLNSICNEENSDLYKSVKVLVNDKLINTSLNNPFFNQDVNTFTSEFNNGLLNLGTFDNGIVNIKIEVIKDFTASQLSIGAMNINKFKIFSASKNNNNANVVTYDNNLICQVNVDNNDQMLFLTIPYDDGWVCTINGNAQPLVKVFDNFIGVPLISGYNYVELAYYPDGFKAGTIISLLTLTCILFCYLNWVKNGFIISYKFMSLIYNLYIIVLLIAFIIFYLAPILGFICNLVI